MSSTKIGVKILPKKEILDVQGRALKESLKEQKINLASCKVGKYVILEIKEKKEKAALKKAKEIAELMLYNPLIETLTLELLK